MTQPSFVPISEVDQVRPARVLEVSAGWRPSRPADLRGPEQPAGPGFGAPGPDQGFALRLAHRSAERFVLTEGEAAEDVVIGVAMIGSKRAARFGRAPCAHDIRFAANLWGFLGDAPADLVADRTAAFRGVAHDYAVQRQLVDRVPEPLLSETPEQVAESLGAWRA